MKKLVVLLIFLVLCLLKTEDLCAQHTVAGNEVVVIDRNVRKLDMLLSGIKPGTRVIYYDEETIPLEFLNKVIRENKPVHSLHIITHGKSGALLFSKKEINKQVIKQYETLIGHWNDYFTPHGDILLYGCEVGKGHHGLDFIMTLAVATGVDIAASKNDTGSDTKGGDWKLEIHSGKIESTHVFNSSSRYLYPALLK